MTETEAEPTCYRHPDRETYVRCTRCDRSICPDCMNAASVGFQCPECVREGSKSVRQARTVFGGRAVAEAHVTKVLVGLNLALFAGQLFSDDITSKLVMFTPAVAFGGEYYRMVSSAFLHDPGFLLHIAFNMYALFLVGSQVERLLGTTRYLALYFLSALGGSAATYAFADLRVPSLGASGAVFGLFGAFFVLSRSMKRDTSQIVVLIGFNLVLGFAAHRYINNYAHVGGLVVGAGLAWVYSQVRQHPRRNVLHLAAVVGVAAVLAGLTLWRTADLNGQLDAVRNSASAAAAAAPEVPSR